METLKIKKGKIKTQDDLIKHLLASKEEMIEDNRRFVKTDKFQKIRKKLNELNKK